MICNLPSPSLPPSLPPSQSVLSLCLPPHVFHSVIFIFTLFILLIHFSSFTYRLHHGYCLHTPQSADMLSLQFLTGSTSLLHQSPGPYITLVRSGMEYASPVWDPSTSKDQDALERVQRRAARWITSSYDRTTSVTKLLRQLNLEPLDKRRRIYRLTFLYKVLNEHVAVPPDKLDITQNSRPVRGSVTKQRLVIPRCSTNELKNSFVPRTIVQWNALPDSTTSAASVNAFRSQLYKSLKLKRKVFTAAGLEPLTVRSPVNALAHSATPLPCQDKITFLCRIIALWLIFRCMQTDVK